MVEQYLPMKVYVYRLSIRFLKTQPLVARAVPFICRDVMNSFGFQDLLSQDVMLALQEELYTQKKVFSV